MLYITKFIALFYFSILLHSTCIFIFFCGTNCGTKRGTNCGTIIVPQKYLYFFRKIFLEGAEEGIVIFKKLYIK